jgi:hypothetical protein
LDDLTDERACRRTQAAACYNTGRMTRAFEEIVDFIAGGSTPAAVAEFVPSEASRQRVSDLLRQEKSSGLTPDESAELNHYQELEHLMRLAKARARAHLP